MDAKATLPHLNAEKQDRASQAAAAGRNSSATQRLDVVVHRPEQDCFPQVKGGLQPALPALPREPPDELPPRAQDRPGGNEAGRPSNRGYPTVLSCQQRQLVNTPKTRLSTSQEGQILG